MANEKIIIGSMRTIRVVELDGEQVVFPRLNLYDINAVCEAVQSLREKQARDIGAELRLTQPELFNVLFELRAKPVTADELLSLTSQFPVSERVVSASLRKSGVAGEKERQDIIGQFGAPDVVGLARDLILDVSAEEIAKARQEAEKAQAEARRTEGAARPLDGAPSTSPATMIPTAKGLIPDPGGYGSAASGA